MTEFVIRKFDGKWAVIGPDGKREIFDSYGEAETNKETRQIQHLNPRQRPVRDDSSFDDLLFMLLPCGSCGTDAVRRQHPASSLQRTRNGPAPPLPSSRPAGPRASGHRRFDFATDATRRIFCWMRTNPRRGVRENDLPLSLKLDPAGQGCYRYSIYRKDSSLVAVSTLQYSTEAESRSRKSAQDDKWSFCLTTGTLCPANQERP
jgi:hypothetical protein